MVLIYEFVLPMFFLFVLVLEFVALDYFDVFVIFRAVPFCKVNFIITYFTKMCFHSIFLICFFSFFGVVFLIFLS